MSDADRLEAILTRLGMPRSIRAGLVDSHTALRTAHRASQWDRAAKYAGDFTFWAYQAIEWGATRHFAETREALPADFARRLAQLRPTKTFPGPELARLANVLSSLHSLTSPRSGAPGATPHRMDAIYLAHASAWLLGEVVRLLGDGQPAAQALADDLANVPRPLAWDREGQALLRLPLKLDERVLAVLYWRHRATLAEMQVLLPGASPMAIAGAAARRPVEVYYRKQDQSLEMLPGGSAWVERELLPRLRGPRPGKHQGRRGGGHQRRGPPPAPPQPRQDPGPAPAKDPGLAKPEGA